MRDLLIFAGAHPFLFLLSLPFALLAFWAACGVAKAPFLLAFLVYNRRRRSMNIIARGWPPPHIDADGDQAPAGEWRDGK